MGPSLIVVDAVDDDKAIVQVIIKVAIAEDRQAMRACVTGSGRSS